ncbi:MAG: TetR/AcrR family transcriptional regulator [Deltaproteobacteria bacterium]|nr:MAG: TetR/AcrR family transcriptional regulator [Deltaproteobacteria bacterium]
MRSPSRSSGSWPTRWTPTGKASKEVDVPESARAERAREAREARRQQILDVALDVFSEKGFHDASITDVVKAAGVARGTFYQYFDSKQAIFHELLDQLIENLRDSIVGVDVSEGAAPVRQQLVTTVTGILDAVDQQRQFVRIVLRVAVGLDEEVDAKLSEFYGNLRAFIAMSLRRGQMLGLIRECDPQLAAVCVLGAFRAVVEEYLGGDDKVDTHRLALGILEFSLKGLLA